MTTDHLFVFSEDRDDRVLKQMEEKALSITNCPSIPYGSKFYIQDARVTPALDGWQRL